MLIGLTEYNCYDNSNGPVWVGVFKKEDMSRIIVMIQDIRLSPRINILKEYPL